MDLHFLLNHIIYIQSLKLINLIDYLHLRDNFLLTSIVDEIYVGVKDEKMR